MTKAKIKTKMPKLPMSPTEREWDQYNRQLVQYQKEQLARKDAQIAALERKVERMTKQFDKARLDFQDWLTRS